MKKRFNEEQITGFLRQAEARMPVKELCRTHGFPEVRNYLWRNKHGCISVPDAKRPKPLESENARLKQLLAETLIEHEITRKPCEKSGQRTVST